MMKSFIPFLVFVLLFQTLKAGTPSFVSGNGAVETAVSPCNLPAPANFTLTGVTSYSISTSWDPVSGASAYDVDVYENLPGGGQVWVAGTTTSGTSATVDVPPGGSGSYDVSVAAICNDGTESSNRSWLYRVEIIIVEIIAGMTPPDCPTGYTEYDGSVDVYVPWEQGYQYQFDVMYANRISRFGVTMETSFSMEIGKVDESYYSPYWVSKPYGVTMSGFTVPPPLSNSKLMWVRDGEGVSEFPVYRIEYQKAPNNRLLLRFTDYGGEDYYLRFYNCQESSERSDAAAEGDFTTDNLAVQNPFTDQLKIGVPGGKFEVPFVCTLFDLNGRVALRQSATVPGETMVLPTESLAPGFYVLQIQTSGGNRTFKVMKAF